MQHNGMVSNKTNWRHTCDEINLKSSGILSRWQGRSDIASTIYLIITEKINKIKWQLRESLRVQHNTLKIQQQINLIDLGYYTLNQEDAILYKLFPASLFFQGSLPSAMAALLHPRIAILTRMWVTMPQMHIPTTEIEDKAYLSRYSSLQNPCQGECLLLIV